MTLIIPAIIVSFLSVNVGISTLALKSDGDSESKTNLTDSTELIDHVCISREPIAVCPAGEPSVPYLGQTPPGNTKTRFAYGIIPTSRTPHGAMNFTSDGCEAYWSMYQDPSTFTIMECHIEGDAWTAPAPVSFNSEYGECGPFLNFEGSRLLFTSLRPLTPGEEPTIRFWSVDRIVGGWTDPTLLDEPFASTTIAWQGSMTENGDIYFPELQNEATQDWDIVRSAFEGGVYRPIELLGDAVISTSPEFAPFVAPDGDFLIFSSSRPGGYGSADLWVCFANPDGSWSEAQNLGPTVNTSHADSYPSVSPDGNYLFFVGPGSSDYVYYWISTSVSEDLRPDPVDCCNGRTGNVDYDPDDIVDLGDLTTLIDYLFISFTPPDCMNEANVDGDPAGIVDLGDLTKLIDYLFITFEELPSCPNPIGSVLEIPFGSSVIIDGALDSGEWDDAIPITFSIEDKVDVTVQVKHDDSSVLAAYAFSFIGEPALCFPEVNFDIGNDKSETRQMDDWWFHVSGTDCEAQGTYYVWNDCSVTQPDWQGAPNFPMVPDPPPLYNFEIRIPFSKINISAGDTIGIGFDVEYIPTEYGVWPEGMSMVSPATWGTAILER